MGESDQGVSNGDAVDRPASDAPETTLFGPYRLIELLGRGGMGEVWRAHDTRRDRTVALKRLASGWANVEAFRQRFAREARATAQLASEHVVVIHDYGEIDGQLFIDMRLISGGDLAGLLATGQGRALDPAVAVNLAQQIGAGLDAAHRQGLIHRDVKPSNVLLAADVDRYRAYLVDFGIAKLADELTGSGLTVTGTTVGTPAYMAPELFEPYGAASPASDVYALACVLFEMLTGRRVFLGSTSSALMNQHLNHPPPAPSSIRGELAPFDALLARALSKHPQARPPSAGALAHEAAAAQVMLPRDAATPGAPGYRSGPWSTPSIPTAQPRPRRWWRSWRGAVAAAVAVVVIAAGTIAGVAASHPPATPPPPAVATAVGPVVPGAPQQLAVSVPSPQGLTFSPDGRRAYIVDGSPGPMVVVDTTTGAVLATVVLPGAVSPSQVAVSPDGTRAYVTDSGSDQAPGHVLFVVDTRTNTVAATIPVGERPIGVAVSPDSRRVYVTNTGSVSRPGQTVSVIDAATTAVSATVPVGARPDRPGISPDGRQVYVPDFLVSPTVDAEAGSTLTVIDAATNTARSIPSGDRAPAAVQVSPDGRRVYIVCSGLVGARGSIWVLDTTTATLAPLGIDPVDSPFAAALSPDGRTLVVPNYGSDDAPGTTASIVDTTTGMVHRVTLPGRPTEAAVTRDGHAAWVATSNPVGLWRIPLDPA